MVEDIYFAAQIGDIEALKSILSENARLINSHNRDGWTPLHLAAHYGHIQAARFLLESGADVNSVSQNEMTNNPVHAAVAGNNTEIVALLLEFNAAVNNRQHGGWTALHGAAQNGNFEMVKLLVAKGASLDPKSDDGKTALSLARTNKHDEIVSYLENLEFAAKPLGSE